LTMAILSGNKFVSGLGICHFGSLFAYRVSSEKFAFSLMGMP
jgi:hypothetical protein